MKRFKLHTELPEQLWLGSYDGKTMHGPGQLYELVENLGLVKKFVGTMHHDAMVHGMLYGIRKDRNGIFLQYDGDFSESGHGSIYDEDGNLLWRGQTKKTKPNGVGQGTILAWDRKFLFQGTHIHELSYEGRLTSMDDSSEYMDYEGEFNSSGLPHGKGRWSYKTNVLEGHFVPNDRGLTFHGVAFRHTRYLGQFVHRFSGCFEIWNGIKVVNHGLRATFLKRGTRYFKFVEDYAHDEVQGHTEVYETDDDDPALNGEGCVRAHGLLLGKYDEFAETITTFDSSGNKTFYGLGFLEFHHEPEFVRDGYGTVYVNGLPRFTSASFCRDIYNNVCELYDEEGKLLWSLDDINYMCAEHTYMDSFKEWPFLNGVGTVFSKAGEELYKINFEHSKAKGVRALVALLKAEDLPDEDFVDPITLDPIHKNRWCILINESKTPLLVKSAIAMWEAGPMIDPLCGCIPGLRIRKVKIVAK